MVKVKEVRKAKKISRLELSKRANISYSLLFRIEQGFDVRLSTLMKIAVALETDLKELL